jgi:hypothetical protein
MEDQPDYAPEAEVRGSTADFQDSIHHADPASAEQNNQRKAKAPYRGGERPEINEPAPGSHVMIMPDFSLPGRPFAKLVPITGGKAARTHRGRDAKSPGELQRSAARTTSCRQRASFTKANTPYAQHLIHRPSPIIRMSSLYFKGAYMQTAELIHNTTISITTATFD